MWTVLFWTWIPNGTFTRTQLSVQSGFQWILIMAFLIVFRVTEQVESNPENTSLVSQHPGAGTSIEPSTSWQSSHPTTPSRHFFPWPPVYIWLCFIHTKEERLFNKESARSALHIIDLLYIIDFGYCLCQNLPCTFAFTRAFSCTIKPGDTKPQQFQSENSTERSLVNFLWCFMNQESVSKERERKVSSKLGPPTSTWSQPATGHGLRQTSLQEPALSVSSAELPAQPVQPSSPHQQRLLSLPDGATRAV